MSEQGRVDLERLRRVRHGSGVPMLTLTVSDIEALLAVVDAARGVADTHGYRSQDKARLRAALEPFTPAARPAGEYVHKVDVTEMTPPSSFASSFRTFNEQMQETERARRVAALGIELRRLDGDEREQDEAIQELATELAEARTEANALEARLARVPALVEAVRLADGFLTDPDGDPVDSLNIAHVTLRAALAEWEQS